MKKFLSILLALALVLSLGTVAFAVEDGNSYVDQINQQPSISKTYKVNNGTAPAETFTYTFEAVSYKDATGTRDDSVAIPEIEAATTSFGEISQNTTIPAVLDIDVDDYKDLGVYTYKVTEKIGDTAGVTYSAEELYLVLSVILNAEDEKCFVAAMHKGSADNEVKVNTLTNEYDSGSLRVEKQIEGNMADMDKKFKFTITFDAGDKKFLSKIVSDNENGKWDAETLTYTVSLGDDESVTLSNIPAGVTYTVKEEESPYASNFVYSDTAETKSISANDTDTVTVTNTLTQPIDTGVFMDSLPYVLLLVGACAGLVVFFARRRMTHKG